MYAARLVTHSDLAIVLLIAQRRSSRQAIDGISTLAVNWPAELPLALAGEASVAKPFCYAQPEQQTAERNAHERNDEREPTAVGMRAGAGKAAEEGLKQCGGQ